MSTFVVATVVIWLFTGLLALFTILRLCIARRRLDRAEAGPARDASSAGTEDGTSSPLQTSEDAN